MSGEDGPASGSGWAELGVDIGPEELLELHRPEPPVLEEIARYYALAEDSRVYADGGRCCSLLARRLAAYAGASACVPVSSGTLGLTVALLEAAARSPSSEKDRRRLVATAAFAGPSGPSAIRAAGLEPLFVDVDPDAWQFDPNALAEALEHHPVAVVLAGSSFGSAASSEIRSRWRTLCTGAGVPLVIDSGAGFGAVDGQGRRLGGLGDVEVFSFDATRPFAIGEGGAICAPDAACAERLERPANFGLDPQLGTCLQTGINARMSELAAAAGLAMLDQLDDVLARRLETAAQLRSVLAGLPLVYQRGCEGSTWPVLQVLLPDASSRGRALVAADRLRIDMRVSFDPPLHQHPAFAGCPRGPLPVTESLASRSLTLPLANSLGPRQMLRLAELGGAAFSM